MSELHTHIIKTLESIRDDISEMKSILAVNTKELEIHIKRTNELQSIVASLDKDVTKLRGFFAVAGWIVGIAATILSVIFQITKR